MMPPISHDGRRRTDHAVRWVLSLVHDAVGADDGVLPQDYTGKNRRTNTDPAPRADNHRFPSLVRLLHNRHVRMREGVIVITDEDSLRQDYVVLDVNSLGARHERKTSDLTLAVDHNVGVVEIVLGLEVLLKFLRHVVSQE